MVTGAILAFCKPRYTLPCSLTVHGPWTWVSYFDTRVHGDDARVHGPWTRVLCTELK